MLEPTGHHLYEYWPPVETLVTDCWEIHTQTLSTKFEEIKNNWIRNTPETPLMTDELRSISERLQLNPDAIPKVEMLVNEIHSILKANYIAPEIIPSLFVDPEVEGWEELRLSIPIERKKYTIELKDRIIDLLLTTLDEQTVRKVIINIELRE